MRGLTIALLCETRNRESRSCEQCVPYVVGEPLPFTPAEEESLAELWRRGLLEPWACKTAPPPRYHLRVTGSGQAAMDIHVVVRGR